MIDVVFENEHFVVLDKPAGISFHSEEKAGFVVQAQEQFGVHLFSVHRLDKMTSGLLVLAKSSDVAHELTKLFEQKKIEKYYLAISLRKPKKKQGWVKGDMAQSRRGSHRLLTTHTNPAITQFVTTALRTHERFFLVKPHTGKTHQIRVALKSLGSPIAGDVRYANALEANEEDRGYLHAYALRFNLFEKSFSFVCTPSSGVRFLSKEAQNALQMWLEPWNAFTIKAV